MAIEVFKVDQVENIVDELLIPRLKKYSIFTFEGPLGAGKTTLIKAFLKKCGIKDVITSPTFNYVNTYTNQEGVVFNHFDLYRIASVAEFMEYGFDEYLYSNNSYNLIEWPSVVSDLIMSEPLVAKTCSIKLNYSEKNLNVRVIEIK